MKHRAGMQFEETFHRFTKNICFGIIEKNEKSEKPLTETLVYGFFFYKKRKEQ